MRARAAPPWAFLPLLLLHLGSAEAAQEQAVKEDLRSVFRSRRCLPADRPSAFPFKAGRLWILEVNPWTSHRVATTIAAILLREFVGYDVDLNMVDSISEVYHRAAKAESSVSGSAVADRLAAGDRSYGYANLEVWPEGKRQAFVELVAQGRHVVEMGLLGYEGREGWFVPASFAHSPAYVYTPDIYRAYDTTRNASAGVLAALRGHFTVDCAVAPCHGTAVGACAAAAAGEGDDGEVHWCPDSGGGRLPAILSRSRLREEGLQEELARSNGFRFALRVLGASTFARLATEALATGAPQVVHAWRPSMLLARLRHRSAQVSRVLLPSDDCGRHEANGTGDWSCDMPRQALQKLASLEVRGDPVARDFFSRFSLPESRPTEQAPDAGLSGAGMNELLVALAEAAAGEARPASDSEVFDAACGWVLANEAMWHAWAKPREIPFFADTLSSSYPLPAVGCFLVLALAYIGCLESMWLRSTLSPKIVRGILEKNAGRSWRSSLEMRLRKFDSRSSNSEPPSTVFGSSESTTPRKRGRGLERTWSEFSDANSVSLEDQRYWEGLDDRSSATPELVEFWRRMKERLAEAAPGPSAGGGGAAEAAKAPEDSVQLMRHVFPCMEANGAAVVLLGRTLRGAFSHGRLVVEVCVEASDGGAKPGKDFEEGTQQVVFPPGAEFAVLRIPIVHHKDLWRNFVWFQVRLTRIVEGDGVLAHPAKATVLVLSDNRWPANIPDHLRGGMGISLMRYFIKADRIRRGEKWKKTMIAMVWLPVHSVLVSTVVQKVIVDHAAEAVLLGGWDGQGDTAWPYVECVLLVLLQLVSLGLNRWADVVQTRNRGRTGGIRCAHRGDIMRKFTFLEHAEHWEASEATWSYSAMNDVDTITMQAYWQVFVLAQSCSALFLSVLLVLALALARQGGGIAHPEMLLYPLGVFIIIPLGILGVWVRRILLWVVVIARKSGERDWVRSCSWLVSHWRQYCGLLLSEQAQLDKCAQQNSSNFVPAHWDARDAMNDTAWITHWIQGIAYCFMLLLGSFALIEYQTYGLGAMQVGTFYALCKIYLSVGKYVGRLAGVFVGMQQAVVSLREIAALLNMPGQGARRREARILARLGRQGGGALPGHGLEALIFEEGLCLCRPHVSKTGSLFGELRLAQRCELPLGRVVGVRASNERVLRSFLALAAQVLQPTGPDGEELPEGAPCVCARPELRVLMVPTVPANLAITSSSITKQLEMTGASEQLCRALAGCVGLDPSREISTLGSGSGQVFSLLRVLLADPDVFVTFRPFCLVPADVRPKVVLLLRVWQSCGGLPGIAELLGVSPPASSAEGGAPVYRSPVRTIVVGNPDLDLSGGMVPEVTVDLDSLLWRGNGDSSRAMSPDTAESQVGVAASQPASPPPPQRALSKPLLRAAEDAAASGCASSRCLGLW